MTTRRWTAAALVCLVALCVAGWAAAADDETGDGQTDPSAKAKEAWGRTCVRCHANPDPRFETDRAFLGQILETT